MLLTSTSQDSDAGLAPGSIQTLVDSRATPFRARIIVNADDFGISEEVNEAIVQAFRAGALTSCSLMVTGEAFESAVRLARENPGLAVGIHLVTVMGKSVLPKTVIPSLVDEGRNFSNNPVTAGLKYFFSPRARAELKRELAAQFEKFASTGLPLSHIDGHLHLHVHPVIFNAALELGAKHGARRMRVPVEERALALTFDRSHIALRTAHSILFDRLGRHMKKRLGLRGFAFVDRVYGNLLSGRVNESYFLFALENLRAPLNEIYFHPAVYPPDRVLNAEERQCLIEFEALTSRKVIDRMKELSIVRINYFDLGPRR
jgi:hopanoid biosynthesis associated protein HpnK